MSLINSARDARIFSKTLSYTAKFSELLLNTPRLRYEMSSPTRNQAVDPTYQGTMVAGSAGQQIIENVFWNLDNAYEVVAVNESVYVMCGNTGAKYFI